jgi:uncharacterized OB-fold protein
MAEASRFRPTPSELTQPFWHAAARRELVRPLCSNCGRSFFTPQICCPRCLSEEWTWAPSTGVGTVYSYTVCHRAPEPGFDPPYVLAIVDLDEGWHMLSNVVGCEPAGVSLGMRVRVAWHRLDDEIVLPVFEPSDVAA